MLAPTLRHRMPSQPARPITSRHNPIVSRFRHAARTSDPDVLIEGMTLIEEAVRARWPIVLAAASSAANHRAPHVWRDLSASAECVEVSDAVLAAISPARTPSGAVALARPRSQTIEELPAPASIAIAAVGVQDPGNLGAIVRSAEALGASSVIACDGSADPYGWKALRGAMGSSFRLPLVRATTGDAVLQWARAHAVRTIGLTLEGTPASSADLRSPALVLVGAEGRGLPAAIVAQVHQAVTIPMTPPVESLNVAVATALLLYEARRQQGIHGEYDAGGPEGRLASRP
jgi:TrmH family RNA methyltransferase